ncbi:hypothetical protein DXA96_00340 [Lachnospiraceae bacterium OF09-33XD]|nr:hypothetical protein DXA96_00340 [Lachnospiraceae bacterium OF09-33XD]
MRYRIEEGLIPVSREEETEGKPYVEVVTRQEFETLPSGLQGKRMLLRGMENVRYCKAEMLKDSIIGTLLVPRKEDLIGKKLTIGYYLDGSRLIFLDDSGEVGKIFERLEEVQLLGKNLPGLILQEVLELFIEDDSLFLDEYEDMMSDREAEVTGKPDAVPEDFDAAVMKIRREMMALNRYYKQLEEMAEELANCPNGVLGGEEKRMFTFFSGRAGRLYSDARCSGSTRCRFGTSISLRSISGRTVSCSFSQS